MVRETTIRLTELGEGLSELRLCSKADIAAVCESLSRQGQLTAVEGFEAGDGTELFDGFKRLHAARQLGWEELRVAVHAIGAVEAKLRLAALHAGRGLSELEEAWLVRSLYRCDRLTQPQIAAQMGRHKSWVCRRLLLAEGLHADLQAQVRLGLLCPRAAVEVGQLPRGNQLAAGQVVVRRGLSVRQVRLLVGQLQECADDEARARLLHGWQGFAGPHKVPAHKLRSEADWLSADAHSVRQTSLRLQARLASTPLSSLQPEVGELVRQALRSTVPTLKSLIVGIEEATEVQGKEQSS